VDAVSGLDVTTVPQPATVVTLDAHPTHPSVVAVGRVDGSAAVVDWSTGATIAEIAGQPSLVRVVLFDPTGDRVATATSFPDSSARVWDAVTGVAVTPVLPGASPTRYQRALAFDSTGDRLASVDRFGDGRVWSVPAGEELSKTQRSYGFDSLTAVRFADDRTIVASGPGGLLERWDATTGAPLGTVEPHSGIVASLALDSSRALLVVGGARQTALFDTSGGPALGVRYPYPAGLAELAAAGLPVNTSFSADGTLAATAVGGSVWVWAPTQPAGAVVVPPLSPGHIPLIATLTPAGDRVLVTSLVLPVGQAEISVHSTETWAVVAPPVAAPRIPFQEVSPDGRWLAVSAAQDPAVSSLVVVDLATGSVVRELKGLDEVTDDVDPVRGKWISAMAFSPDSQLLAASNHRGAAAVWDVATGEIVGEPLARGSGAVVDLVFTPSGREVAMVGVQNVITVVDLATRQQVGTTLTGPSGLAVGLEFDGPGLRLLSGGSDGVRLWDVSSGTAIGRPFPSAAFAGFRWLADGSGFLAADATGMVVWWVSPARWRDEACRLAGRNLTQEEWAQFGDGSPVPRCQP
jgi:WD40 repeat protein